MSWYEVNVNTTAVCIEAVSNLFTRHGAGGVQIVNPDDPDLKGSASGTWDFFEPDNTQLDFEGVMVTAYLDREPEAIEATVTALKEEIGRFQTYGLDPGAFSVSYKEVHSEDWENEWKKYFKPFRLGKHMVVKPSWEHFEAEPDDIIIEIDPGNAFGSGTHETTSMCIETLERFLNKGDSVIDVGCGSGILSIAAGLLGAGTVTGIDIDPTAVRTARENVTHNGLSEKTAILEGDLIDKIDAPADIVVANIIAEIIVNLVDDVKTVLKEGALFVASGIITDKIELVTNKLKASGFEVLEVIEKGEWAVVVSRPNF